MGDEAEDRYLLLLSAAKYDFDFLLRIRGGLKKRGWRIVVVTHLISVWISALREDVPCILIRSDRRDPAAPAILIDRTHEGKLNELTTARARRFEASAWASLKEACKRYPVGAILQWNGQGLAGKLCSAFARRHGLAAAYVELGNVGRKLFVDPEGVSGAALVARRPDLLDRYEVSDSEIAEWRAGLTKPNGDRTPIPQARNLGRINPWYPINLMGDFIGLPAPASAGFTKRLQRQLGLLRTDPAPLVDPSGPFVFLALQVSSDTNLLLFSDYNAHQAIRAAEGRAKALGATLVVKPHPAERNIALLRELERSCAARGHLWTSFDTIALVMRALEVVTVNSTVGLIARALERPVTVLGRSVYGAFSPRQAAVFALRHLVDIDPFGVEPADQVAVDHFLTILEMSEPHEAEMTASAASNSEIKSSGSSSPTWSLMTGPP